MDPARVEVVRESALPVHQATGSSRERELEVGLEKILEPLKKKEPKKPIDAKLREFASQASGTKVGSRASRLADAAAFALNELK